MATKIHHIPPLAGSGELHTLLGVINDKDRYRKALTELEEARRLANQAFENQYKAREIDALHSQATSDRDKAKFELAEANALCDRIKTDTANDVKLAKKEIDAERERFHVEHKAFKELENRFNNESKILEKILDGRTEKLNKLENDLTIKQENVEKLSKELKGKLAKIRKTAEEIK